MLGAHGKQNKNKYEYLEIFIKIFELPRLKPLKHFFIIILHLIRNKTDNLIFLSIFLTCLKHINKEKKKCGFKKLKMQIKDSCSKFLGFYRLKKTQKKLNYGGELKNEEDVVYDSADQGRPLIERLI